MKKNLLFLMVLSMCIFFTACSNDDGEGTGGNTNTSGGSATNIVINENGKASNGGIFSAVDDKNFYLDYIKYTVEEGHLAVSSYDKAGFKGEAKIVSSITYKGNYYEVLSIDNNVFRDCERLTSLTIPNSMTSIGSYAFSNCVGLTSLTFPNSVTSIGSSAFSGCTGLTSLTLPNSVTSIDKYAFSGCTSLTSLTIPANVTTIGEKAFSDCSGLTSIVVDKNNSVYDSRENCNAIIETATNTLVVECSTTVIPSSIPIFSNREHVYCAFDVLRSDVLFNVMGNYGHFASIRKRVVEGKTQIELVSSTGLKGYYPVDQLSNNYGLGLGGLIVGTNNFGETLCYDLACPICDRAERRLSLTNDGYAKCTKCGVIFDLNNLGAIYQIPEDADLPMKRGLCRYRINYNGQIVNAYN